MTDCVGSGGPCPERGQADHVGRFVCARAAVVIAKETTLQELLEALAWVRSTAAA